MDEKIKDQQWWEDYFSPSGGWERNGGREQTRIFAQHFSRRIKIDRLESFSLLDAGCALGEALKVFKAAFPNASLHGIDFSKTAVERCRKEMPNVAQIEQMGIEEITGKYDIIYCSNVLEHFADFDAKARGMAKHCSRLCILVPYLEMDNGRSIRPNPRAHHQHTFDRHSFDFLIVENLATNITTRLFSCPGAWGWTPQYRIVQKLRNLIRPLLGKQAVSAPRQIFYDIVVR
jgi:SAM-dependent methyltransferase